MDRTARELSLEKLTNAEILERPEFQKFCAEKKIEPSKRQVSKNRAEFTAWHHTQFEHDNKKA